MKHFPKVIGLSGVARAGKDSFYKFLKEELSQFSRRVVRVAFADELKKDLDFFIKVKTGILASTKDTKEKEIIRPVLVAYGQMMRNMTEGRYWINLVSLIIEDILNNDPETIVCITDVRFPNEVEFIKDNFSGYMIHLSRRDKFSVPLPPPNDEERVNDPIIRSMSDCSLRWDTFAEKSLEYKEFVWEFLNYSSLVKLL